MKDEQKILNKYHKERDVDLSQDDLQWEEELTGFEKMVNWFPIIIIAVWFLGMAIEEAQANPPQIYGQQVQYLGNLSSNQYDPNSTSNQYGRYGSEYSPDSINNPYGMYGSQYSNESANNPYATQAPKIISPIQDCSGYCEY
jgi:hypothetical protein